MKDLVNLFKIMVLFYISRIGYQIVALIGSEPESVLYFKKQFGFLLMIILIVFEGFKWLERQKRRAFQENIKNNNVKGLDTNHQKSLAFEEQVLMTLYDNYKKTYPTLNSLLIKTFNPNKPTVEIDILFFHSSGIYCIEAKNYAGLVKGNLLDAKWEHEVNGKVFSCQNPIKQNDYHIVHLKKVLKRDLPIINLVVFNNHVTLQTDAKHVILLDQLIHYIESNQSTQTIDYFELKNVYKQLKTLADKTRPEAFHHHIKTLQKFHNSN
jgi:hypothetical protein